MVGNKIDLMRTSPTHHCPGISQTFASFTRSVGPTIAGVMFAWSEEPGHKWPFNFHFMWDLLAIMTAILLWRGSMLPKYLDKKKIEE